MRANGREHAALVNSRRDHGVRHKSNMTAGAAGIRFKLEDLGWPERRGGRSFDPRRRADGPAHPSDPGSSATIREFRPITDASRIGM